MLVIHIVHTSILHTLVPFLSHKDVSQTTLGEPINRRSTGACEEIDIGKSWNPYLLLLLQLA